MYYNILSYCMHLVCLTLASLIPRPSLDLPVFIMKDRERAAQLISFILTLQCAIVPSLARQPYEGGIVAERDGQVPRGGGSMNETK